jgi:hypothetical protein
MKRVCLVAVFFLIAGMAAHAAGMATPPFAPLSVKAKVQPYKVKADLSNIANLRQFGKFTPEQKALLAKNAFFVSPSDDQQLYFVYENNDYLVLPSFVSTDTVLQLYHIFYDYTLREVEGEKLIPLCEQLTRHMYEQSQRIWEEANDADVKTAALKNVAYFGVAMRNLGMKTTGPAKAETMIDKEMITIKAHEGRKWSAIFPYKFDFSQFVPRGHYTRSEKLKKYFMAMMWYGLVPLPLEWPEGEKPIKPDFEQIRQSLLITYLLYTTFLNNRPAIETWQRIYEPTVFYVETADDLTPEEWKAVAEKTYGKIPGPENLADKGRLEDFFKEGMKLRGPQIANVIQKDVPTGRQFRFMGQRVIPDSYMLQELVFTNVGTEEEMRLMPTGMDVMAALGSNRAYYWLDQVLKETHYVNYDKQLTKLKTEFAAKPESAWRKNLYWGWLWSLRALLAKPGAGYPSFMLNDAWLDKSINSVLASWSELRHDTILYAKQSVTSECGDGEEVKQPPVPKGYVEPQVQAYHRMIWLTKATREGLEARQLLSPAVKESFKDMEDLLTFLERISVKELANQPLKAAEYDQIRLFGANLELLTNQVTQAIGGEESGLVSEADEDMAVVADVHTDPNTLKVLEEGVGHAGHIYVVAPILGKLYLTRGAVFSHFEFTWPMNDRLTDEAWQKILGTNKAPKPPLWTRTFMGGKKATIPKPKLTREGGGC